MLSVVLLIILLGGGFGCALGVPPAPEDPLMAQVAPAECLLYMSWSATATPDPDSDNRTERLLAEPGVAEFLASSSGNITRLLQRRNPESQSTLPAAVALASLLSSRAGSTFITDFTINAGGKPAFRGGGFFHVAGSEAEIRRIVSHTQSTVGVVSEIDVSGHEFSRWQLPQNYGLPPITWGIVDGYLVVGAGDGVAQEILQRRATEAPPWLQHTVANLSVPHRSSIFYLNVAKCVDIAARVDDPLLAGVSSLPGLRQAATVATVSGMDEKGIVRRTLWSIEGAPTGIWSWLNMEPLVAAELAEISEFSTIAFATKLAPATLFDSAIVMAQRILPDATRQWTTGRQMLEQQLGFHLRDDFLAALGDTCRVYVHPENGLLTGWIFSIDVRDMEQLTQVVERFVQVLSSAWDQQPNDVPSITTQTFGGHTVYTLEIPPPLPLSPSWCVTENRFLFAASAQTLRKRLRQTDADASLTNVADVAAALGKGQQTLALSYVDMAEVAKPLLPVLQTQLSRQMRRELAALGLPALEDVLPHLQPMVVAFKRVEQGLEIETHQTLPAGNISALGPTVMALFLPATESTRLAGQAARSRINLKRIGLALHNYLAAYRAFPAGYSVDENGKPLLSWRVHVLPFLEQQPLYNEFRLNEPWDSPHNRRLIEKMPAVFRSPRSSADQPGKAHYLGVAGADGIFVRPGKADMHGIAISEVRDGMSKTIMLVEVPDDEAQIWTRPADFAPSKGDDPAERLWALKPPKFEAGFADGRVRTISGATGSDNLRGMFTKSGREVVNFR